MKISKIEGFVSEGRRRDVKVSVNKGLWK